MVYAIIDREVTFIEMQELPDRIKEKRIAKWYFVRNTFQQACIDAAQVEGIFKKQ